MTLTLTSAIYDFSDYFDIEVLINKRLESGLSTYSKTIHVDGNAVGTGKIVDLVTVWLPDSSPVLVQDVGEADHQTFITRADYSIWVMISKSGDMISVTIKGEKDLVSTLSLHLESTLPPSPAYIRWVFKGDGDSVKLPVNMGNLPRTEFYPQLGESLVDYYEGFKNSDANVLLLYGPPGTGKTSFIRGYLAHTQSNAIVTYDTSILERDSIFASFLSSGREDVMVFEDADLFLGSRTKGGGNTVMHRFLNVGDGLISTRKKKIIFSTNLPTIKDVDPALMRAGRCFDTLAFRPLSPDESRAIRSDWSGTTSSITLADLFNQGSKSFSTPIPVIKTGFSQL